MDTEPSSEADWNEVGRDIADWEGEVASAEAANPKTSISAEEGVRSWFVVRRLVGYWLGAEFGCSSNGRMGESVVNAYDEPEVEGVGSPKRLVGG